MKNEAYFRNSDSGNANQTSEIFKVLTMCQSLGYVLYLNYLIYIQKKTHKFVATLTHF